MEKNETTHTKKRYLWHLRHAAERDYRGDVMALLEEQPDSSYLDCGCATGIRSMEMAAQIRAKQVSGIEIVEELAQEAKARGMLVLPDDLNNPLSFSDDSYDVITSLEAIEHLHRPETFVKEIYRILKPNGYAVISTENLASWHNIFALLLGWQPFTMSQFSELKTAIGNPLGLDKGETTNPALKYPSFRHCLVLSYQGFKDLFETHGFVFEEIRGAGYYPLPVRLARLAAGLDARHSAFLTIKVRKPGFFGAKGGQAADKGRELT
ncbi:class I SAM-dependent methyltransferase [PVC group bacterium]|nr:class I SAM-dependent methyltransferase [PVC group bacterium]